MTIKRGGCEEHSTLFAEMAQSVGIQSRVIYNFAEDHMWSEVLINESWIHFDPMLSIEKRFNNTDFYELSRNEGGWEKQLSHMFFIDQNSKEQDITSRYTDTGRLTVLVEKDGVPVENAKVSVKSRFLMENSPKYHEPLFCLEKNTNASGLSTFDFGGNNYTVVAEYGSYRDEIIVTLKENDETKAKLLLKETSLFSTENILLIVLLPFLAAIGFLIHRKWKNIRIKQNMQSSIHINLLF